MRRLGLLWLVGIFWLLRHGSLPLRCCGDNSMFLGEFHTVAFDLDHLEAKWDRRVSAS